MKGENIWEEQYEEKGLFAQRLYPNEALVRFLGTRGGVFKNADNSGMKVLELGCGTGTNLWMMAKEGLDCYGVDISPTSLSIAKKHLAQKWGVDATLREGRFDDIPFEDNMFDYVVDVVSMQHIDLDTSEKALSEIRRVLKVGGKFFSYRLGDHSPMFLNSKCGFIDAATVKDMANTDLPLGGNGLTSFWSPSLARLMYSKAGLVIEEIESDTRSYNDLWLSVEYLSIVARK